jgi:transposase
MSIGPSAAAARITAGVDWAKDDHAVCVAGGQGEALERFSVRHDAAGLRQRAARLLHAGVSQAGIERGDGPVVDTLLAAGLTVFVIPPGQVKNLRSRYGPAGSKDDRFGACVLAGAVRTGARRLRPMERDSEQTTALRSAVRARRDLAGHRVAAANQLRARLQIVFPAGAALFAGIDSPITLRVLNTQIRALADSIGAQLAAHPDAAIFTSLPRAGTVRAARLPAGIGDARGRFPDRDSLTCLAGVAPSTRQSGKVKAVTFRRAAGKQLRDALCDFAGDSRRASPWAAGLYDKAIARGCDHPHAVRILARAWAHVIWRCWQDHQPYDPATHNSLQTLLRQQQPNAA